MLDKVFTNNQVTIAGKVVSEFAYSHTVYGEDFYTVDIEVSRLSNSNDIIPVMVSERILDVHEGLPWICSACERTVPFLQPS